jgi:hypothetical protein
MPTLRPLVRKTRIADNVIFTVPVGGAGTTKERTGWSGWQMFFVVKNNIYYGT